MNHHPIAALLSALSAGLLGGVLAVGKLPPELGYLTFGIAAGNLLGQCITLYRDRRGPNADRARRVVAAWSIVGFVAALVYVVAAALT
jgi:hypothetical protein